MGIPVGNRQETDTGWRNARYVGASVVADCVQGQPTYRVYAGGLMINSHGVQSGGYKVSGNLRYYCSSV